MPVAVMTTVDMLDSGLSCLDTPRTRQRLMRNMMLAMLGVSPAPRERTSDN